MKKYCFTGETIDHYGVTLHRIKALIDIPNFGVKAGDLGGWIEKEENLSHDGDAWVMNEVKVYADARVYGDARICDNAQIYGKAQVYGHAWVHSNAIVYGKAEVFHYADRHAPDVGL